MKLSDQRIRDNYAAGRSCWTDEVDLINGERTGAIRVSLGRGSKKEDVDAFISFLKNHFEGEAQRVRGNGGVRERKWHLQK